MMKSFSFTRHTPRHEFDLSDLNAFLAANRRAEIVTSALDALAINLVVIVRTPAK